MNLSILFLLFCFEWSSLKWYVIVVKQSVKQAKNLLTAVKTKLKVLQDERDNYKALEAVRINMTLRILHKSSMRLWVIPFLSFVEIRIYGEPVPSVWARCPGESRKSGKTAWGNYYDGVECSRAEGRKWAAVTRGMARKITGRECFSREKL